jgi:hypothetical protein
MLQILLITYYGKITVVIPEWTTAHGYSVTEVPWQGKWNTLNFQLSGIMVGMEITINWKPG